MNVKNGSRKEKVKQQQEISAENYFLTEVKAQK
jgi:hypothetical protein